MPDPKLAIHPLTASRWPDLVKLFGPRGACGGCWCMWWRVPRAEFVAAIGAGNRRALQRYVKRGQIPGLLAYDAGEPVGWVAVEPRAAYPRLARSPRFRPVDDTPVWSITCFFVARDHRGRGVTRALVQAAARHARRAGARILEAYPVDVEGAVGPAAVYPGIASTFRALGFAEAARRSPSRPIVRLALRPGRVSARPAPAARARGRARSTRGSSRTRASGGPRGP